MTSLSTFFTSLADSYRSYFGTGGGSMTPYQVFDGLMGQVKAAQGTSSSSYNVWMPTTVAAGAGVSLSSSYTSYYAYVKFYSTGGGGVWGSSDKYYDSDGNLLGDTYNGSHVWCRPSSYIYGSLYSSYLSYGGLILDYISWYEKFNGVSSVCFWHYYLPVYRVPKPPYYIYNQPLSSSILSFSVWASYLTVYSRGLEVVSPVSMRYNVTVRSNNVKVGSSGIESCQFSVAMSITSNITIVSFSNAYWFNPQTGVYGGMPYNRYL